MNPKRITSLASARGFAAFKRIAPLTAALALATSTASAALVAYDGFDGATVFNGGTGWTGDWTAGIDAGVNLTFGGLTTTGAAANILGAWEAESNRSFAAQTSGVVWFSWIQSSPATDLNQIRFMSGGSRLFTIGQHFDAGTFKIYDTDFNTGSNSSRPIFGTHLIVVSVDLASGVVNLYVDPTGIGQANPTSAPNGTWDGPAIASINKLQSVGWGQAFVWDEVRVGTSWADVTPGTGDAAPVLAPAAPTSLQAVANSFSDITLTWTDASDNEDNFVLERSPDGVNDWTVVASPALNVVTSQDIGLSASTTYYYRLKSTNVGGDSAYTSVASTTTPAMPASVALTPSYLPFVDEDGTNASLIAAVPGFLSFSDPGFVNTSSALTYAGVSSSGNGFTTNVGRVFMTLDTSLPGYARYLSGGRIGASGLGAPSVAPIYVSWMARGINPQEANQVEFRTGTSNDNDITVAVGTTFANDFIRLMTANAINGGINNYVTTTIAPSPTTSFFVAKFTFGPGNTSTVDLYVNQLTEGTPDATTTGLVQFNTIAFAKFGGATPPAIDEFRIGTSWTDVGGSAAAPLTAIQTWFSSFSLATDGSAYTTDTDSDGVVNLLEYAFDADPTISDGGNKPTTSTVNVSGSDYLAITFIRLTNPASGITYTPQASGDLADWSGVPVQVGTAVNNNDGTETVVFRDTLPLSGNPKRFLRVRVVATAP
jgi:hypothetical protein